MTLYRSVWHMNPHLNIGSVYFLIYLAAIITNEDKSHFKYKIRKYNKIPVITLQHGVQVLIGLDANPRYVVYIIYDLYYYRTLWYILLLTTIGL